MKTILELHKLNSMTRTCIMYPNYYTCMYCGPLQISACTQVVKDYTSIK